jgi:hypothetical protein
MVSADDGWAVGEYGTILRWDGRAWRPRVSPTLASLYDGPEGVKNGWYPQRDSNPCCRLERAES